MRFLRPSNCPSWKKRRPGDRNVMTAAASCIALCKGGGRPWLVVILHEAGKLALVVEPGVEVLANGPCVSLAEPIVEPLVVGVVEALLQHASIRGPSRPRP